MGRLFLVFLLVSALILSSGLPARGCGDKLLVLGRSVTHLLGYGPPIFWPTCTRAHKGRRFLAILSSSRL